MRVAESPDSSEEKSGLRVLAAGEADEGAEDGGQQNDDHMVWGHRYSFP